MSWPIHPLDVVTEIYLYGLGWVDISSDTRLASASSGGGISATRGQQDWASVADAGSGSLVINNRLGRYSLRNPRSEYSGILGRNTPLRVAVRLVADEFDRTASNGWGDTPDGETFYGPQTWSVWGSETPYSVTPGAASQHHSTDNSVLRALLPVELADCEQVCDITIPTSLTGASVVTGHIHRTQSDGTSYWCRAEFDPGGTITLKVGGSLGGFAQELGSTSAPIGYTPGQPVRLRSSSYGGQLALKVWDPTGPEPLDWQLVVVDTSITAPGKPGLASWVVEGNTDVPLAVTFSNYQLLNRRFYHEVPTWPQEWDLSGEDRWTPIQTAGLMKRLGRARKPVASAMTRYIESLEPVGWWPFEDGVDSRRAAPGLPSGQALTVRTGVMDFTDDAPPGASGSAHPDPRAYNQMTGPINGGSSSAWQFSVMTRGIVQDPLPASGFAAWVPMDIMTSIGRVVRLIIQVSDDPSLSVIALAIYEDETATEELDYIAVDEFETDSEWHLYQGTLEQSGSDVTARLYIDGTEVASGTLAGITVGAPAGVVVISAFRGSDATYTPSPGVDEVWVSQLAVFNGSTVVSMDDAAQGFNEERAGDRLTRLCAERGVPFTLVGDSTSTARMGPQKPGKFLELLRECAAADGGILVEDRCRLGLLYITRNQLYNRQPLELSYSDGHVAEPFRPVEDDQLIENDVTISRGTDGSSYRVIQHSGPLNVNDPEDDPDGVGTYDVEGSVNVAYDLQLFGVAGWRKHLGTWPEARFPNLTVNLAASAYRTETGLNLAHQVAALEAGQLVEVSGLPEWLPPEPVLQMIQGYTETLDAFDWEIAFNATPGGPWQTGVRDDLTLGRRDTSGSVLVAPYESGVDTRMLVATTKGNHWTTEFDHYPFDLRVAGVQVRAVSAYGAVWDLFDRSESDGWGTPTLSWGEDPWTVNGTASSYTVSFAGQMTSSAVNTLYETQIDVGSADQDIQATVSIPVVPTGAGFTVRLRARQTDFSNYYEAQISIGTSGAVSLTINKRVAGVATTIGTARQLAVSHTAGTEWGLRLRVRGSSLLAKAWRVSDGQPGGWPVGVSDTSLTAGTGAGVGFRRESGNTNGTVVVDWTEFNVNSPQVFEVEQEPVNGIDKTADAGTSVQLWQPAYRRR